MNALFLCGKGRIRSPAAADIALEFGVVSDFAGIGADADERVTQEQIDWAEKIFVMERRLRARLADVPGLDVSGRKIINLDVPDRFRPGDAALAELLRARLAPHLP
ncbi:MAG: phosphotyrosine protein phosphatase [Pseudomonadota bacterium]